MQSIARNNFGGQLGEVLGTGLNQLAQFKLAQLTQQHEQQQERSEFAKTWEPYVGRSTANFLSNLGPDERRNALGNLEQLTGAFQQPGQEQNGLAALGQNQQSNAQIGQQAPDQGQQIQQAIQQHFGHPQSNNQQFGLQAPQQPISSQQQGQDQGLNPDKIKLIENLFKTPQQKAAQQKLEIAQKKEDRAAHAATLKETKQYVDDLKNKEKAAKEGNLRLKRMEVLIDKGNLPNAAIWSALSKLEHAPFISGLTAPFAEILKGGVKSYSGNPADIEEFEKLSNEFIKNAKQYFGSRITQKEVELFLQTLPNLMQTDTGKKKIIQNIRSLNALTEIEAKAARSIINANGGTAPIDIEQQVQDKIGNKFDKVAKKFIAN
jgi:hypothetical protein